MVSPFVSATWLRHRLLDGLKNLRVVDGMRPPLQSSKRTPGGWGVKRLVEHVYSRKGMNASSHLRVAHAYAVKGGHTLGAHMLLRIDPFSNRRNRVECCAQHAT